MLDRFEDTLVVLEVSGDDDRHELAVEHELTVIYEPNPLERWRIPMEPRKTVCYAISISSF